MVIRCTVKGKFFRFTRTDTGEFCVQSSDSEDMGNPQTEYGNLMGVGTVMVWPMNLPEGAPAGYVESNHTVLTLPGAIDEGRTVLFHCVKGQHSLVFFVGPVENLVRQNPETGVWVRTERVRLNLSA